LAGRVTTAEVLLWDEVIGAAAWDPVSQSAVFEYTPQFLKNDIEPAPLTMPKSNRLYRFNELSRETYLGLPGMLADALPDRFGNLLIDRWLAEQGRSKESFSPVERLCYVGTRAMGALEFRPAVRPFSRGSHPVRIDTLTLLADQVLNDRRALHTAPSKGGKETAAALNDIFRVGTSAGGARAKAVVAWNKKTGEFRSGQVQAPPGFTYWLLKFDGVSENKDKELADPKGFGRVEFAYHRMAVEAGIEMSECRLLPENGRCHFMTRRFDRTDSGEKIHLQSLCAAAHMDFNMAGAYSYEQAMMVMLKLRLPKSDLMQFFLRMVFNVMAKNMDDHTKNIAFLMKKSGVWRLSPAYDITFAYNPEGSWTARHQMTVNAKQENICEDDLMRTAHRFNISKARASRAIDAVKSALQKWPIFAEEAGVPPAWARAISEQLSV
jgi:serine/threonine-protein kinase HipA